jgi:Protein of unknown function (DUF3616)
MPAARRLAPIAVRAMLAASLSIAAHAAGTQAGTRQVYRGMCDASAAVALDAMHFAVADDERNTLQVYRRGEPQAVGSLDVSTLLGTKRDKESDLEGAATIGTRTYWISSHGRNSSGERQERRLRFFATQWQPGSPPSMRTVGRAYAGLLEDLLRAPQLEKYKLADAAAKAPEADGGLNIEGLAAAPDGRLLIGLRNPLIDGRALLVTLENPAGVAARGERARLGAAIELDLAKRGIRSIERVGTDYLIVAGPTNDQGSFALYRWAGSPSEAPVALAALDLSGLHPEALFAIPGTGQVQLLSDDGGVLVNGVACKELPTAQRSFRSLVVTP